MEIPGLPQSIHINMNGKEMTAATGTKIVELLGRAPHLGELPPLGAIANGRVTGLYRELTANAEITTIDYNGKHGADIYRRSANIMLYAAVLELYPDVRIEVGQSLGQAYFFELIGKRPTKQVALSLEKKMREYVERDIQFRVKWIYYDTAVRMFKALGAMSKVRMLSLYPVSEVGIISLMNYHDTCLGAVSISTGALKNFSLTKYRQGLLLTYPSNDGAMQDPPDEKSHALLYDTFKESRGWNELMGVSNVSDLIEACVNGKVSNLIKVSEALHEKKIGRIADMICRNKRKMPRLILVAGPSSSGKTTFSQRLGVQLFVNGIKPRTLSMDNYYIDRNKTPKHPDGTYDFESVYALDLPLFNDHMARIIRGEKVEMPIFSFNTGKRKRNETITMQLGPRDVLIVEGIHALNNLLHEKVPAEDKFKIFVSALTQLCLDEHNRIFTSDTRLIRRMVRDRMYRGYSAAQTLTGWSSVREGEQKWVFPFQNNADVMFNSALTYEHSVLKLYAKRFLMEVRRHDPAYTEAARLYRFLGHFIPIFSEEVPPTSVLREFIGGSTFQY